jgi:hypothetical protein
MSNSIPVKVQETMTATRAATSRSQPASLAARTPRKEVTTMIKKIQEMLFSRRRQVRDNPGDNPRDFNGELLDGHREYVYVLMHQHMRGLS